MLGATIESVLIVGGGGGVGGGGHSAGGITGSWGHDDSEG